MEMPVEGAALADAVAGRQAEICRALSSLGQQGLHAPSRLPRWSRLTIACHLRYGASASRRMTVDTLAGGPTAFYPQGRDRQRDRTLRPEGHESAVAVVASLNRECLLLDEVWRGLTGAGWSQTVEEPTDNPDLGSVSLWVLAALRLTEVEVHGHDLDLDLSPWSDTFVSAVLPMRLLWLPARRSNHAQADRSIDGTWALVSTDGPSFVVRSSGGVVEVVEGVPGSGATVTITGSGRQLLAFILGRASLDELRVDGDPRAARSFLAAFPPP